MRQNTPGSSARLLTAAKSSLFKAIVLSAAMLAFGAAPAYAASASAAESCKTAEPTLTVETAILYSTPEGDYVLCTGSMPPPGPGAIGKKVHFNLYEGKHVTITTVDGTGWNNADFSERHASQCDARDFETDGKLNTCEFNVEGKEASANLAASITGSWSLANWTQLSNSYHSWKDIKALCGSDPSTQCSMIIQNADMQYSKLLGTCISANGNANSPYCDPLTQPQFPDNPEDISRR